MAQSLGPVSARRIARLGCGALIVVGLAGACRLDDRTLTDTKLNGSMQVEPGGGQCPNSGDTACETCIYQQCCDELQACGPGSACERYLTCVTECNTDQACANGCVASSPMGVGAAVELGVCASGGCSACSGPTAATTNCDPSGPGVCQTPLDCAALDSGALEDLDLSACAACDSDLVSAACESCLADQTGLSLSCSGCITEWLACAVDNCLLVCQGDADPDACELCMSGSGCSQQLMSCGFGG
jgi:hypothetical protein